MFRKMWTLVSSIQKVAYITKSVAVPVAKGVDIVMGYRMDIGHIPWISVCCHDIEDQPIHHVRMFNALSGLQLRSKVYLDAQPESTCWMSIHQK